MDKGLPALKLSDGTLETLKWIGLAAMTGDHVNKYLFNATLPALYEIGRLALPIFAFALAYNLARPGTLENGAYLRTIKRLALYGAIATAPIVALGGLWYGLWPLNILFTLLVATVVLYLIEIGTTLTLIAAGATMAIGGGLVEFWWPAVIGAIAVWRYCKRPSVIAAVVVIVACGSLAVINKNWWALAAIPLIATATQVQIPIPRVRWIFYVYYPLHLAALWLIRIPMAKVGYIFVI